MDEFIIRARNLGKRFRIAHRAATPNSLGEAVQGGIRRLLRPGSGETTEDFWALREITFDVKPGEALGIVGRNGTGKSTLLKILGRITYPTEGTVSLRGRVASLLEVGTGFHPELTGRENIFLSGAILGMKHREIKARFDEIVAFAEVESFLDTPVKRYSSGMYVRLAFAIAAHLEPEILLIDEVLAVGDAEFQKKCLGKMGDVAHGGRTILFVSHNMRAVEKLCTRAIHLDGGRIAMEGEAEAVVRHYLEHSMQEALERTWPEGTDQPGSDEVRIRRVAVRPEDGSPGDAVTIRTPLVLEFDYAVRTEGLQLLLSVILYRETGEAVFCTVDREGWERTYAAGLYRAACHIPGDLLNDGMHRVFLCLVRNQNEALYYDEEILTFGVREDVSMRGATHGKWPGAVRPLLDWDLRKISEG